MRKNLNGEKIRVYIGQIIHNADTNSSGIKYVCYTDKGIKKADTLQGIKKLINDNL